MRKILYCILGLMLAGVVAARQTGTFPSQTGGNSDKPSSDLVISDGQISRLNKMPSFKKGGFDKYWKWVMYRVSYPADMEARKVGGMVKLRIIVETDGTVSVDRVVESPAEALTDAVVRVVENSPKWAPGMMLDEATGDVYPVRVAYLLPVEFKVRPQDLVDPTIGRYQADPNLKPYGN